MRVDDFFDQIIFGYGVAGERNKRSGAGLQAVFGSATALDAADDLLAAIADLAHQLAVMGALRRVVFPQVAAREGQRLSGEEEQGENE